MTMIQDADAPLTEAVLAAARAAELRRERPAFDRRLWEDLCAIGVPTLTMPESLGGEGGTLATAVTAVQAAHRYPVAVPIADVAIVTAATRNSLALPARNGITVVLTSDAKTTQKSLRIAGSVESVPWARQADSLIVLAADEHGRASYAEIERADVLIAEGSNLADEPRDTVTLDCVELTPVDGASTALEQVLSWGALARAAQLGGAIAAMLELTVLHATTRKQFGQPLAGFQAVQHHLAAMAGEVVAAKAAIDLAVELVGRDPALLTVAAAVAKTRAGSAANECARLAHQVHGAIGFTREHDLQRYTRRLWSWRDEYGTEREWGQRLGRLVPGDRLWQTMTSLP